MISPKREFFFHFIESNVSYQIPFMFYAVACEAVVYLGLKCWKFVGVPAER